MKWVTWAGGSLFIIMLTTPFAAPVAGEGDDAAHGFVGVDGCKICHKKESAGEQYGIWLESGHAKAYETLGTEEAAQIAADKGLEGNPQELDACLKCHVTAHGVDASLLGKKYSVEEGVGCESCHGAGADYKKKSVMKDREKAVAAGMMIPTEETCRSCHNEESPTFAGFEYEEMWAKIAHPVPEGAADDSDEDDSDE